MTNQSIFYIIGLVLGALFGYLVRVLIEPMPQIRVVVIPKEGASNEQREAD